MNSTDLKLRNPPIVEAVLDLDCDLPPGLDLQALEPRLREAFCDVYPEARPCFLDEHQIEASLETPSKLSIVRRGLQAWQFVQKGGKQLVQARSQGFSFNRLAPYEGLDGYLPEIERTWRLYCELVSPVQVRVVRLRYINRMPIPLVNGSVQLQDYVTGAPQLPAPAPVVLNSFLTQTSASDPTTGQQMTLLLTNQPPQEGHLPLILDIVVAVPVSLEPSDWRGIQDRIESLRVLKNQMFRHSVTERCLSLFQ
jgi:uncharacterized protein (TIGR04255 family)